MATVNEKLNGIIGGQDVMLGILRQHGEMLVSHDAKLDSHDGKLDIIVGWIQSRPD